MFGAQKMQGYLKASNGGPFRCLQDESTEVHTVQTAFRNQVCIQGESSWRHRSRSGGSTCIPAESCYSPDAHINQSMLQRHCRVQCIASRMKMVQGLNMRHPEAYGEPFCSLLDEATEIYVVRTAFKKKSNLAFLLRRSLKSKSPSRHCNKNGGGACIPAES